MKKYRKPSSKNVMLCDELLFDGGSTTLEVASEKHISGPQRAKGIGKILDDEEDI